MADKKNYIMQTIQYPPSEQWPELLQRPLQDTATVTARVRPVLEQVRREGDSALLELTRRFDGVQLARLAVTKEEIDQAEGAVSPALKEAVKLAAENINRFHSAQQVPSVDVETRPGVRCWQRETAIDRVGLYIPGGSAPLLSTVLMLALPAKIAGCEQIVLCTPPDRNGEVDPALLYCARYAGIRQIYKVGGAQAIAAMAYGTETIPQVDKLFGPGNQYVTAAKQLLAAEGMAIDMPAGPSELLVLADESAPPDFIAADLLSQAEHGPDSQVLLISTTADIIKKTMNALEKQLSDLPRQAVARKALENSRAILVDNMDTALQMVNRYAPEHLIVMVRDTKGILPKIRNAGSVFVGLLTPEAAGDYASGTNHTLPTNGLARSWSGLNLSAFRKTITFQEISPAGLQTIGPAIEVLARAETLDAHCRAVSIRLQTLNGRADGN